MNDVPVFRLYLLRAGYLLVSAGLIFHIWPQLIRHSGAWPFWYGVGASLLAAVSVLAILGLRYPLQMLPVLFFELVWKAIWFTAVAFPMWRDGQMNADAWQTVWESALVVILLALIPWSYVLANYVNKPGDRWW
jgi:hypothetical protein